MDGILVDPAAFKAVVGRAERPGCVRFAHISATKDKRLRRIRRKRFLMSKKAIGNQFQPASSITNWVMFQKVCPFLLFTVCNL